MCKSGLDGAVRAVIGVVQAVIGEVESGRCRLEFPDVTLDRDIIMSDVRAIAEHRKLYRSMSCTDFESESNRFVGRLCYIRHRGIDNTEYVIVTSCYVGAD
jgi:hypothetical protein